MQIIPRLCATLLLTLGAACATTKDSWSEAKKCGTVECLSQYLSNHPNSEYTKEATEQLSQATAARARDATISQAWSQAKSFTHSKDTIEVKTWTIEPCLECASVEKGDTITVTTAAPTISRIKRVIEERLSGHKNPRVRIEVDRHSSTKLRLRAYGLKREVLSGFDYWEYIYMDVSLAQSGSPKTYEVSLTLAANYKAGGQPATITGYSDMLTSGYSAEMNNYASSLVSAIKATIESTEIRPSSGKWK